MKSPSQIDLKKLVWTVVVGLAITALYDLLKPAAIWLSDSLVSLGTLGLEKRENKIYVEVARGSVVSSAMLLISMFSGMASGLFLAMVVTARRKIKLIKQGADAVEHERGARQDLAVAIVNPMTAMACTAWLLIMIQISELSYVWRASSFLTQMQTIVSPFNTDQETKVFASRIAQIRSKRDYAAVSSDLLNKARSNNVVLSGLTPP